MFYLAVEDPLAAEKAVSFIENAYPETFESRPPVIQAYGAALEGLRGKHAQGLLEKLDHVQRAVSLLKDLPERNPESLEILFLRFSFFHQIPFFFGVRSTVSPDLSRLIVMLEERAFDEVPRKIQKDIVGYLIGCGEAGRAQKERLQALDRELETGP